MRLTGLLILLSLQVYLTTQSYARELSVTTFNIRFYGVGGEFGGAAGSEPRDPWIKKFFDEQQVDPDVFEFEEIVDVDRLTSGVLDNRYNCTSYNTSDPRHQHVVICYKLNLRFVRAPDDDNYTLEDVAMGGRLRPAVHGIITNAKGDPLIHIVAVHLKAYPDQSATRLEQMAMIARYLADREDDVPVVLLGDFNAFYDDVDRISDILTEEETDLFHIDNPFDYTFRTLKYRDQLDHFWVSDGVDIVSDPEVIGPCNNEDDHQGSGLENIPFYNENVSDHCPVNIILDL